MKRADPSVGVVLASGIRRFSKTIAVTYVALGFFGLLFLIAGLLGSLNAFASQQRLLLVRSAVLAVLAIGVLYEIVALHRRQDWARRVAIAFWFFCLIWSVSAIVRNGSNPPAPSGWFEYANQAQLEGARFSALATPYLMTLLELPAIYCLWRRPRIVNQFKRLDVHAAPASAK